MNIDELLLELEAKKAEAIEEQKKAIAKQKTINAAIKKAAEAKKVLDDVDFTNNTSKNYNDNISLNSKQIIDEPKSEEIVTTEIVTNNKKSNFGKGFTCGALAIALIGGSFWALSRESKTGKVLSTSIFNTKTIEEPVPTVVPTPVVYDYDENTLYYESTSEAEALATYAYDFEANASETTETVNANGQPVTNPIINEELPANVDYVPLTTEAFEDLTASLIKKYEGLGMAISREDITKYVMIRNIDKLKQDNIELVQKIIGSQDPLEVFADADQVIDAIMTYNLLYFDKYHTTDGFISAADGVFDEVQKARALEIEARVYELGKYYKDEEKYNELTYTLLRDMINPLNPISELEDGVSYGVEWIDMYMVRSTFGTDRYIKLNETNENLVKYFVAFVGDGDEYTYNALVNGNTMNINALLKECTENYTRTK